MRDMRQRRQTPEDRPVLHAPRPPIPEMGDKPGETPEVDSPERKSPERGVAIVDFYL